MVGDILHFGSCGLGCAYVHAAVQLHAVGGDNFAVNVLGKLYGNGGFANSSGPGDYI
jgi:hypothetical protein